LRGQAAPGADHRRASRVFAIPRFTRIGAPARLSLLLIPALLIGCRDQGSFQGQLGVRCQTGRDCTLSLRCQEQTKTCQLPAEGEIDGLGADCATNNDCPAGLLCQPETTTCQVIPEGGGIPGPVLLGGSCPAEQECDAGLVCQFASGTCQPPTDETLEGLGASCLTNGDCAGDLVCQPESSTCQPPPA